MGLKSPTVRLQTWTPWAISARISAAIFRISEPTSADAIVDSLADGAEPPALAWAVRSVGARGASSIAATIPHTNGP